MMLMSWLGLVAGLQVGQGGEPVRTKDILKATRYSRSTTQLRLKELISSNYILRIGRGRYVLNPQNELLIQIGLCVLLPMDVYEYQSKKELLKQLSA